LKLVPARSTITTIPFGTSFNTGHGRFDARDGRVVGGPWHDMSRQDLLPSWQFAYTPGANIEIGYDFERAFRGGSSLRFTPEPGQRSRISVPLFLASLPFGISTGLEVAASTRSRGYSLVLTMVDGTRTRILLQPSNGWRRQGSCLNMAGKALRRISIEISSSPVDIKPLNLGMIQLEGGCQRRTGFSSRAGNIRTR
jgi:endo-beta-N-acetylglucosaminidase D